MVGDYSWAVPEKLEFKGARVRGQVYGEREAPELLEISARVARVGHRGGCYPASPLASPM